MAKQETIEPTASAQPIDKILEAYEEKDQQGKTREYVQDIPLCTIKHCNKWAESMKRFGLELCYLHQNSIDKWLIEKGYTNAIK